MQVEVQAVNLPLPRDRLVMNPIIRLPLLFLLLWAPAAHGQTGFQTVAPGREFRFPQDHGAHPEFKTEWWYYSGHLTSQEGQNFGYQLTFFRVGLPRPHLPTRSAWVARDVYWAHWALTAPNQGLFWFREKAGRGALGLAGAQTGALKVWVDDWRAEAHGDDQHLMAQEAEMALDLTLTPLKPPVLHGQNGYSRKSLITDVASFYYSITRMATRGKVTLKDRSYEVVGESWLDREFATGQMPPHLTGWDWFALQLSNGDDLMLYLMRRQDGTLDPASSGTLVDPQGRTRHLSFTDFQVQTLSTWKSPHSGAIYPAAWEIAIPDTAYHLRLHPTFPDQELRTAGTARLIYWEGQVTIQGKKGPDPLTGRGYVELTGYAGSLGGRF